MSGYFGHLRSIQDGDKDAVVGVSLHDYTPPQQRDLVPDGNFAFKVVDGSWRKAASGNGANLQLSLRLEEPAEFKGAMVSDQIYVPFDDGIDELPEGEVRDAAVRVRDIALSKIQHLVCSIASKTSGRVEELQALGEDGRPKIAGIGPKKLIGQVCYAETQRAESFKSKGSGRTVDRSKQSAIRYYVRREQFEARKGPFPVTSESARSGARQESEPEVLGGNGAARSQGGAGGVSGSAALNQMVDL